jgi:hypothetical protein
MSNAMSSDQAGGVLHFVMPRAARGGVDVGGRVIGFFQIRLGSVGESRRPLVALDVVSVSWVRVELRHSF